jgi:hypothetical protein
MRGKPLGQFSYILGHGPEAAQMALLAAWSVD